MGKTMKRIFHGRKYDATVRLLDGEEFNTEVTKGTSGREILDQVCKHVGLDEVDFFGLKYVSSKDRQLSWLDNVKTVGKQMGNGPYQFVFRVKFYPPNPAAVREDITRYQIVLQLRDDLLKERLVCSVPIHALLASYLIQEQGFECPLNNATALGKGLCHGQWCPFYVIASHFAIENEAKWRPPLNGKNEFDGAINRECECKCEKDLVENNYNHAYFSYSKTLHEAEKGDYCSTEHSDDYIDGLQFMPNQGDDFLFKVHEFHKKHKGLHPADAEYHYLDNARKIPLYGMDLHDALDGDDTSVVLGVSETGIHVILKGREISKFSWSNIHKVYFKSKRFYLDIRVVTEVEYEDLTVGFKCRTRTELKRLYRSAIDHHTFFRRDVSVPGIQKVSFFKLGSRFRYSGRKTFQQLKTSTSARPPPTFQRVSSQRLTSTKRDDKVTKKIAEDNKREDQQAGKDPPESDANQDDGSPCISRDVVILPNDQDPIVEKENVLDTSKQNNGLAVTITISPPTPIPGGRRVVDVEGNADDNAEDSPESYEVIELNEDESSAGTEKPQSVSSTLEDKEENDAGEPVAIESHQTKETVVKEVEKTKSSQETTSVVTSTTTTTKVITQTEIVTVDELNEEIVIVEEEHISSASAGRAD